MLLIPLLLLTSNGLKSPSDTLYHAGYTMSYVRIYGTLTAPDGSLLSDAELVIAALSNNAGALRAQRITIVTGINGEYDFRLAAGSYRVTVRYAGENRSTMLGDLLIEEGGPDGSLNDYLRFADPQLTNPTVYADIERMHRQATGAASDSKEAIETTAAAAAAAAASAAGAEAQVQAATESIAQVKEQVTVAETTVAQTAENARVTGELTAEARAAAEAANNAAAAAESAAESDNTFTTVSAGLAATQNGAFFRVPGGAGNTLAFTYYLNDSGAAVAVSETVGLAAITKAVADAAALNERTGGLQTQAQSENPFEIVDVEGKAALWLTEKGQLNAPGGLSVPVVESTNIKAETLSGQQMDVGSVSAARMEISNGSTMTEQTSPRYLFSIEDSEGKVPFGLLPGGNIEYCGFPLVVRSGLPGNDFFFIGDSITAFTQSTSGAYNNTNRDEAPCVCEQGWPVWAQFFSAGRVNFAGISATGGYRADQILATHVPVAVAAAPTFCVVLAGRNNIVQRVAYDQTVSDMEKIFKTLRQAGIIPVCCAMSAQTGNDDEQNILRYNINAFVRSYAQRYALPFVDFHADTTDPATGEWFSGWNYDASHPTGTGALAMGQCFAAALEPWTPPVLPPIPASQTTPAASRNLIPNPMLLENDGINPAGWTVVNQSTSGFTEDAGVKGAVWQLALSGSVQARRYITLPVTPGERLGFGFVWRSDTDSVNHIYIVAGDDQTGKSFLAGVRRWTKESGGFGTFYREFTVPDGTESVTIVISASGLSIGQIGLTQITEI